MPPMDMIPTGTPTGPGSLLTKEVTTAIAAAARFLPSVGLYYAYALGADVRLQVLDSTGAWNNVLLAGAGGMCFFDGVSVGFINNGGANENVTLIKVG